MNRPSITSRPLVKKILVSRIPQWSILVVMLAGFLFAIMAGFIGTPVGNRNFGIVFIWIAWWAVLILVAVPLLGRGWCAVCPIPLPGEWLQRRSVLGPEKPGASPARKRRWPRLLRNMWVQNVSFTLVALFSAVILTSPAVTSAVLGAMLLLAIALSFIFERRAFCRYVCPVGGFIGLYSQVAPIELRTADRSLCRTCVSKPCYNGSAQGFGCPWDVFPPGLGRNTYCGLCLECVRTCPSDNIAIRVRAFGADLERPSAHLDEAFKAFVMLGSAMIYAGVLLGPWGALKNAAFHVGTAAWLMYAGAFLSTIFLLLPGLFYVAVRIGAGRNGVPGKIKSSFGELATALIPLGLMFWGAFSLSFVLTNASYIVMALSDPLGWGWNLFGGASIAWQPVVGWLVTPAQTLVLAGGLLWSGRLAVKNAARQGISPHPVLAFCLAVTVLMIWLLV